MEQHMLALRLLYDALAPTDVNWAVTGSLGLALQGVRVMPHDIDIQTDRYGAYELAELFPEAVTEPVAFSAGDRMRSHFGILSLGGVRVEVMGDVQHRLDDGSWEPPVDLDSIKRYVEFRGMRIPVLSLEHEFLAYTKMGRTERAREIAQSMRCEADSAEI